MSTNPGAEGYWPASSIDPEQAEWQVLVDGVWRRVDMVVETERDDGVRLIWFYFIDHRPAVALKSDLVRSRIPEAVH